MCDVVSGENLLCICFHCLAPGAALVVRLLYGLSVGATQVYPSSAADAILIPVATMANSTNRLTGVGFNG